MGDLRKGYTFTGTSPNNSVTAEKLNTLVDDATVRPGFYLDKPEIANAADDDVLLVYDASTAGFSRIQKQNLISTATAKSGFTNLRISCTDAAMVSVDADELVLRNESGGARRVLHFEAVALLANYSGGPTVGGRDFPTIANNSWVYVWAVSDGTNDRVLLSQSATSPTLPGGSPGYQYRVLLGAARVNGSGALVRFSQEGVQVSLWVASAAGTAEATLNPYTGGSEFTACAPAAVREFQPVDLSRCIPPNIVARVQGMVGSSHTGTGNCTYVLASHATGNANTPTQRYGLQVMHTFGMSAATYGWFNTWSFEVPVRTSQEIDWACSSTAAHHNMRIHGFTLAL